MNIFKARSTKDALSIETYGLTLALDLLLYYKHGYIVLNNCRGTNKYIVNRIGPF